MSEEGAEGVPLNQTGNVATTAAAAPQNAEISTASSSVVDEGETQGLATSKKYVSNFGKRCNCTTLQSMMNAKLS